MGWEVAFGHCLFALAGRRLAGAGGRVDLEAFPRAGPRAGEVQAPGVGTMDFEQTHDTVQSDVSIFDRLRDPAVPGLSTGGTCGVLC